MSKQSELDEILDQLHVRGCELADGETNALCNQFKDEAKQAILDWHNKQIEEAYSDGFRKASKGAFKSQQAAKREAVEEVLDRLAGQGERGGHDVFCRTIGEAVLVERNKLKESTE